jgi:hypothetical protein
MLLSAGIHAAIFLGLGSMIVFHVIQHPEVEFVPPQQVERPNIPPVKPKVKVSASLKQAAPKRVSVDNPIAANTIALPSGNGLGEGVGGGDLGGFELVPNVSELTLFGGNKSTEVGNDFEGTFYLLNRLSDGTDTGYDQDGQKAKVTRFLENDWSPYMFADYYKSPKKLYATQFMVPLAPSMYGPRAFGVNFDSTGSYPEWVVHYKGKISR